jgi:hypothetical protein
MANAYTEDHLVEQPAIQLMQHELGWDETNCFGEWQGGVSDLGREGKREVVLTGRLRAALLSLNPDLPEEAIDGAVEELSRDRTALSLVEANREIHKLRGPNSWFLFALEPDRQCNQLIMNEFLFDWKTSVEVSPLGETERLSEILTHKLMKSSFSRYRENVEYVKIGLSFTKNSLFTAT